MPHRTASFPKRSGNTLSEYAIIIGLIGIACIGALSLMGTSVDHQYRDVSTGNSAQTLKNMSKLNFQTAGSGNAGGGQGQLSPNGLTQPTLQLANTSSGGTNVTSIEGNTKAVLKLGIQTANQMEDLASKVTDPDLKAWYRATADIVLKLSSSQAAYELGSNPNTSYLTYFIPNGDLKKVTTPDAVKGLNVWQDKLQTQLNALSQNHTASAADIQQAQDLVSAVINTNEASYAPVIQSTDTSKAELYDPNVNQVKKAAELAASTGILEGDGALTTSVTNGLEMDTKGTPSP